MDHRQFLAQLPAATKARLVARSNAPGLRHLAVHGGAILGLGVLIALRPPGWVLLLPVQGVLLVFLFTLEHEATHKTPFAIGWLNEWAGRVCGVPLLLPFGWFRYFHLAHHRYTHDPQRDPELQTGGAPASWAAYLLHVSGLPYWRAMIVLLARLVAGRGMADFIPQNARGRVVAEARWMALAYALLALTLLVSPVLLWVWIVPVLLGQPVLRLYLMAEHGRCPHVADMFDNTRTTFTTRAVRWLAWNMPFHAEHHVMPAVPFHKLPELHRLTRAHLRQTEDGYAGFHRAYVGAFGRPASRWTKRGNF